MTMKFLSSSSGRTDALILPFWQGKRPEAAYPGKAIAIPALKTGDFSGKAEELLFFYPTSGKQKRIILVGLGEKKALTDEVVRRAYAQVVRALNGKKATSASVLVPEGASLTALIEGMLLANYSFDQKSEKKSSLLQKVVLQGASKADLSLCKKQAVIAECVYFVRNLVIGNADDVTPTHLAKQAQELAKTHASIQTKVMNRAQIEKEKMGLLMAVSRGATTEPAFITLHYKGDPKSSEETAIIGKGITFDTGGLLIKPRGGMETMRDDMAGGAVVLGTLRAAAELKLPVNLIGVIASTENAVGPDSYKPGDVYVSHAGVSVEITDTDAEGRLVLADAISYTQKHFKPKRIIDLATLTGGAIVALGEEVAVICSNDDKLSKQLFEAGEATYERIWRMPLYEEFKDLLKSKIADIKNAGPRKASSICGGIFIERFVKKTAWAHLDIAGVAFPESLKPYQPAQATGWGVRLLITFLENLYAK